MRYLVKHALKIASAGVIVLTFLSYLSPYVNPALFRWLAFFGTAFPWFLLGNVILLLVWGARVHRFALYHAGIIFLGWQYVSTFVGFNAGKDAIPENAIRVATHNTGGIFRGINYEQEVWEGIYADYMRLLKANGNPDILCVQECGRKFYLSLAERMGYKYVFHQQKGAAILSRYPIERGAAAPFAQPENTSMWADIRIGQRLLRVYNVHLQSNKVTSETEKVIEDGELDKRETWRGVKRVLRKVGGATGIRAGQAALLREHIAACPHPVLLCGDFNDTPNSFVYHLLSEPMNDTFRDKGFGPGITFGGVIPFLRIDYILSSADVKTYACKVVHDRASDHYPVFAWVGF